jgi:hypothetical protein
LRWRVTRAGNFSLRRPAVCGEAHAAGTKWPLRLMLSASKSGHAAPNEIVQLLRFSS